MNRFSIYTLGCKVNKYESEAVAELFLKAGWNQVEFTEPAELYLINTCTVTSLSDRKSRQIIRRAKHLNPEAAVAVMGCYAQTAPDAVAAVEGVDIIVGTDARGRLVELAEQFIREKKKINLVSDIGGVKEFEPLSLADYEDRTRAFLKVQEGCNQFCSYCIIPYARGRVRSRALPDTVEEARRLAAHGFRELVLAGIHVASYGKDFGDVTLLDLIRAVHEVEGIGRIRMSSVEPTMFTEAAVRELASLPKVCPHFHLSLQSGCDATLNRMNRKYTTKEYSAAVERLRAAMPDVAITTDIMVGFPQETAEEFEHTYRFVEEIGFADAHIFKYSIRQGTVAERMDGQIAPQIKEERSKRLLELTAENGRKFRERFLQRELPVLFEQRCHDDPEWFEGKTANYLTVKVKTDQDLTGEILPVHLNETEGERMTGELKKAEA